MQTKSLLRYCFVLYLLCNVLASIAQTKRATTDLRPTVSACINQYNYQYFNLLTQSNKVVLNQSKQTIRTEGSAWQILQTTQKHHHYTDYTIQFVCTQGILKDASVSVDIDLDNWADSNYLLMPASVYNGNKYAWRRLRYSPKLHDIKDIGPDKPIIINDVPKLGDSSSFSSIQERSGSMSTPAIGARLSATQQGFWLLTQQKNSLGDLQMNVAESRNKEQLHMRITSPVVREQFTYQITNAHYPSWDKPHTFKKGDTVFIKFRWYSFAAPNTQALFQAFANVRKAFQTNASLPNTLPYAFCMQTLEQKFNHYNYVPQHGYYAIGMRENYLQDWQIGWTGGMISTYPLLWAGNERTKQNVINNFNWLFPKGIAPSGFYWDAGRNGTEWIGGDIRNNHTKNWHLIRKSGDAVWYILKQFMLMQQMQWPIEATWHKGNQTVCDALVQLWNKNHQLGQFVDSQTGDIIVGGSSSGAIVPAALALAAQYYQQPHYLEAATAIAQYMYDNFTQKGIACGGPGDALQAFDSESAYALVESFTTLYEHTQQKKWLQYAEEAATQFATWVVSYDYQYPDSTAFAKAQIKTTGSVYANIQNKHTAPGICTASGLALLKLYKYTQNKFYLSLIQDIAHNITQYLPHPLHPIGQAPTGWVSERVNMTDWEGPASIGYVLPISTWAETSLMLTTIEIPGIYIDQQLKLTCFDNVEATVLETTASNITIKVHNPTAVTASVTVLVDSDRQKVWGENRLFKCPTITVAAHETKTFVLNR